MLACLAETSALSGVTEDWIGWTLSYQTRLIFIYDRVINYKRHDLKSLWATPGWCKFRVSELIRRLFQNFGDLLLSSAGRDEYNSNKIHMGSSKFWTRNIGFDWYSLSLSLSSYIEIIFSECIVFMVSFIQVAIIVLGSQNSKISLSYPLPTRGGFRLPR